MFAVPRPSTAYNSSSFNNDEAKQTKRDQVHGLNRMDFETFKVALSDIANSLYGSHFSEAPQGEA